MKYAIEIDAYDEYGDTKKIVVQNITDSVGISHEHDVHLIVNGDRYTVNARDLLRSVAIASESYSIPRENE